MKWKNIKERKKEMKRQKNENKNAKRFPLDFIFHFEKKILFFIKKTANIEKPKTPSAGVTARLIIFIIIIIIIIIIVYFQFYLGFYFY